MNHVFLTETILQFAVRNSRRKVVPLFSHTKHLAGLCEVLVAKSKTRTSKKISQREYHLQYTARVRGASWSHIFLTGEISRGL
jgi:hypothetical protein